MPARALTYFNKILRRDRKNTDVLINKGYSLHLMGKYGRAILCYNKVLKQDPDEMNAIYYKAKSTARLEDAEQTYNLISKLLKIECAHEHEHEHHEHEHEYHEHEHFLEKIQKDSDFKGLRTNPNFMSLCA